MMARVRSGEQKTHYLVNANKIKAIVKLTQKSKPADAGLIVLIDSLFPINWQIFLLNKAQRLPLLRQRQNYQN